MGKMGKASSMLIAGLIVAASISAKVRAANSRTSQHGAFGTITTTNLSDGDEPQVQELLAKKARDEKINELLNMQSRPTIAEIENALTPWPRKNPFRNAGERSQAVAVTKADGPKIIASLEAAYPGGTYAFLGRDSALIADMVDAFYRAHGQNHRVVRLNASGQSLVGSTPDILVDFLATNGLHLQSVDQDPPFIIIDATSYSPTSQSRQYIGAFYSVYQGTQKPLTNLLMKVNVIDIKNSNYPIIGSQNYETVKKIEKYIKTSNAQPTGPDRILKIDGAQLAYSSEWHGPFLQLQRMQDGRVFAPPGGLSSVEIRQTILGGLYDIIGIVSTKEFYSEVQKAARELGYEFPEGRARERTDIRMLTADEIAEQRIAEAQRSFKDIISELGPVGEDAEPMTENGMKILSLMKSDVYGRTDRNSGQIALMFLAGSVHAFENGKISARDLRRLIKRLLANYPIASEDTVNGAAVSEREKFESGLAHLYHNSRTFEEVWNSKREYFLNNEHKSGPLGSKAYERLSKMLEATCSDVLKPAG